MEKESRRTEKLTVILGGNKNGEQERTEKEAFNGTEVPHYTTNNDCTKNESKIKRPKGEEEREMEVGKKKKP